MNEYSSRQELAERAGVDRAAIDRLVELGILSSTDGSFGAGDLRRVRVVESLVQGGLPLPALAEAIRRGDLSLDFVDHPSYDRFGALADVTFAEVSAQTGVPLELLLVIREAMGFTHPEPDDRIRESELEVVPMLKVQLEHGLRSIVVERSLRVFGDSLGRMAETEAAWWNSEILEPLLRAGKPFVEIGELTAGLATDLNAVSGEAILALLRGRQSNAWMKNIFEGFERRMVSVGLHAELHRPPAICFLDLTGYTRLTEERGDEAAAELAGRLGRLVERTSRQHGGKPVKWLGDGVMFHFREPGQGVLAALEMVEGAAGAKLPPAHVGLHAGPVLFQEGDYFGRTVNVAARIADYARPGEVLVSRDVVDASQGPGIAFEGIGSVELKGLSGPMALHRARRAV